MLFQNPILFDQAAQDLLPHLTHKITITPYGGNGAPHNITIECVDCPSFLSSSCRTPGRFNVRIPNRCGTKAITTAPEMSATSRSSGPASHPTHAIELLFAKRAILTPSRNPSLYPDRETNDSRFPHPFRGFADHRRSLHRHAAEHPRTLLDDRTYNPAPTATAHPGPSRLRGAMHLLPGCRLRRTEL